VTFACQVCTRSALEVVAGFEALPRITSDCRPWRPGGTIAVCTDCGTVQKIPDNKWFDEAQEIYSDYQIHSFFGGAEQVVFDESGRAAPRSRPLIDFVLANVDVPKHGALIDVGCGNGAALANFSAALPSWSLCGLDLSDAALGTLQRLPNFDRLYTVPMSQVDRRFDLITIMHAMAQMPDPYRALLDARGMLIEGGTLFLEVADFETSPFDLLVADDLIHFSPPQLGHFVERAGFSVMAMRDDVLPKEISLLARPGDSTPRPPRVAENAARVRAYVDWFTSIIDQAGATARQGGRLGIFGSSISATWLYGALGSAVSFFVDEDKTRIGQTVDGHPIVAVAGVPAGATVLMPLMPHVADAIIGRVGESQATYLPPPRLQA
jgi:SAM-dependent methyltransferase